MNRIELVWAKKWREIIAKPHMTKKGIIEEFNEYVITTEEVVNTRWKR